jgi:ankyrin repeat protein
VLTHDFTLKQIKTTKKVHHLLNLGAPVNQRDRAQGWTALHRAARLSHLEGYLEIYEYLLVRYRWGGWAATRGGGVDGCLLFFVGGEVLGLCAWGGEEGCEFEGSSSISHKHRELKKHPPPPRNNNQSRGADPSLLTDDYDPYLDPGPKRPIDVVGAPAGTAAGDKARAAILALEARYASVPKAPAPHADVGDWCALCCWLGGGFGVVGWWWLFGVVVKEGGGGVLIKTSL